MIPKRAFWFAVGAAAGVVGARRAESELQARREQLTPANLAKGAAGKLTSAAAGAPGKVGGAVKGRVKNVRRVPPERNRGTSGTGAVPSAASDAGGPGPRAPRTRCGDGRPMEAG